MKHRMKVIGLEKDREPYECGKCGKIFKENGFETEYMRELGSGEIEHFFFKACSKVCVETIASELDGGADPWSFLRLPNPIMDGIKSLSKRFVDDKPNYIY